MLKTLDARLSDFQQVLPRLDPHRGLLVLGGLLLKQIFGTATVSDIHAVLDELRQRNSDIAHSVSNQLSYVKDFGKINAEAIANLSNVVQEQMIQSHEQLLNLAKDMFWLNATFHTESSVFAVIRQIEFTLMQLIQQIDGLFNAVQYAILGKLPIKLIGPLELQGIWEVAYKINWPLRASRYFEKHYFAVARRLRACSRNKQRKYPFVL